MKRRRVYHPESDLVQATVNVLNSGALVIVGFVRPHVSSPHEAHLPFITARAEVDDHCLIILVDQDVGRVDLTVDQVFTVEVIKPFSNLIEESCILEFSLAVIEPFHKSLGIFLETHSNDVPFFEDNAMICSNSVIWVASQSLPHLNLLQRRLASLI